MRRLVLSLLVVLLSACGGGGGGGDGDGSTTSAQASQVVALRVAIDGDSLAADSTALWPTKVAAQFSATYQNNAMPGSESWRARYAYDATFHEKRGDFYILIVGTNDLREGIEGIPETFTNIRTTWAKARADGFKVIAATVGNGRAFQGATDETALAYREQLNALIRGASSQYDGLIQLDRLLPNQDDASVYIDGVHFTDAGASIVSDAVVAEMKRLSSSH